MGVRINIAIIIVSRSEETRHCYMTTVTVLSGSRCALAHIGEPDRTVRPALPHTAPPQSALELATQERERTSSKLSCFNFTS